MEPTPETTERLRAINTLMMRHSERTAVVFTHLPHTANFLSKPDMYLNLLDTLSRGLPPCVMVHGTEKVVTYSIDSV